MDVTRFSEFVRRIYAAGENPEKWQDCAEFAGSAFGHGGAIFFRISKLDGSSDVFASSNVQGVDEFVEEKKAAIDPRVSFVFENPGIKIWHDYECFRGQRAEHFEYNHWLWKTMPHAQLFGFSVWEPEGDVTALSIVPYGDENFEFRTETLNALKLLEPHVTAAFRMNRRLGLAAAAWDLLDRITSGAVVLDAEGRVLAVNSAAEEMSALRDGLEIGANGLRAALAAETRALQIAFDAARTVAGLAELTPEALQRAPLPIRVSRPSGRAPFVVSFAPSPTPGLFSIGAETPVVIALIADLASESLLDPAALTSVFGFSEAEARVASLLSTNCSVEQIAERLGVSINTVRFHLRGCFRKSGAKTQAELVAMLRGMTTDASAVGRGD